MGYKVTHGRMKPKYNPNPNAAERAFEAQLRDQPCFACGMRCEEVHHTRLEFPGKVRKREHRWQLPLCRQCHADCHKVKEPVWLESIGKTLGATVAYMNVQWGLSQRKAA